MRRAIAGLVLVVVCASCGSGGGASSSPLPSSAFATPSATPTAATGEPSTQKKAFADAANAACRQYATDIDKLPYEEDLKLDHYVQFLKDYIRVGDVLQARLRKIPVPPEDATGIEHYLKQNDDQSRVLNAAIPKVEAAVRAKDQKTAQSALESAFNEFDKISSAQDPWARSYGLTDCANPPQDNGTSVQA